ncbi:43296_t:CDS:2, partial [Gigaspora margarita]
GTPKNCSEKSVVITEDLELYYDLTVPSKDILDTWISKLKRPAKHVSQSDNKTIGTLKIKNEAKNMNHINKTNIPENNLEIEMKKEKNFDMNNAPKSE